MASLSRVFAEMKQRYSATVNPRGFSFSTMAALTGSALRAFKAKVAELMAVRAGTGR